MTKQAKLKKPKPDLTIKVEEAEEELRQFDLTAKYGPISGKTRLERWERAEKFGLDPPQRIKDLLENRELQQQHPNLNHHLWHNVCI